jgi:hypothetical protein
MDDNLILTHDSYFTLSDLSLVTLAGVSILRRLHATVPGVLSLLVPKRPRPEIPHYEECCSDPDSYYSFLLSTFILRGLSFLIDAKTCSNA